MPCFLSFSFYLWTFFFGSIDRWRKKWIWKKCPFLKIVKANPIDLFSCGSAANLVYFILNWTRLRVRIKSDFRIMSPHHVILAFLFVCYCFFFVIVFVFGIVYLIFWVGSQCAVEKLVVFTRDRLRVNYIRLLENGSTADRLNDGFISQQGFFTGKWWGKWEDE